MLEIWPASHPYPATDHRLIRIIALHLPLRRLRGVLGDGWHGTRLLDGAEKWTFPDMGLPINHPFSARIFKCKQT